MVSARQISLSAVNWIPLSGSYFNESRKWNTEMVQKVSSEDFPFSWNGIQDVEILEDSVFLLTNECQCPIFNLKNDCCDGNDIATNYYFYNKNRDFSNTSINNETSGKIFSSCYNGGNQYGITFPIYSYKTSNVDLNLIEFNNEIDEIPASSFTLKKEFGKILNIHSDIGFVAKDYRLKKTLKANQSTILEIPSSKNIDFVQLDKLTTGFYGDSPCNSDLIITKSKNNVSDIFWLSGFGDNRAWVKRNPINTNEYEDSRQFILEGIYNKEISYDRFGDIRNKKYIQTFDSNLFIHLSSWSTQLVNANNNYDLKNLGIINEKYKNNYLELDGKRFAYISSNVLNSLITNDLTINLDFQIPKTSLNFGQIFGNYYKQGFGVFFNTGMDNNNIAVIGKNGIVYSLNKDGILTFLKDFKKATNYSNFSMQYVVNDLDGAKWIYDSFNKIIFKYETDDIISTLIELESNSVLSTNKPLYVDGENQLWVMDTYNRKFLCYSEKGWLKNSINYSGEYVNFYFDLESKVPIACNNTFVEFDSELNKYEFIGLNLYKNGKIFRHFGKEIHDLVIDQDNNILIVHQNTLLKLNSDGAVIFKKTMIDSIANELNTRINIIKDLDGFENYIIQYNDNRIILKTNDSGDVVQRINLYEVLKTSNQCEDIVLNTKGDFTGHYVHKLANWDSINRKFPGANRPYLNLKCKFNSDCKSHNFINVNFDLKDFKDLIGISVVLNNRDGKILLYLNSDLKYEYDFGSYNIDLYKKYSENVSPFIFGGNAGKIGSLNQEWNLKNNYLKGEIHDFRWYDCALSYFQIRSLFLNSRNLWQDLVIDLNINSDENDYHATTYIDKVESFRKASFPGAHSNYFNVRIDGANSISTINKKIVETEIEKIVEFSKPDHTFLNQIIWD